MSTPKEYGGLRFDQIDFIGLLSDFDQGVLMTDANGVLVFYNDIQARMDNLDPQDVLGKKISDVYLYDNDSSTCMRVLKSGRPIINYGLSYRTRKANVGMTIHSVFPLFREGRIIGTICFVKDYNLVERRIPAFLMPRNKAFLGEDTEYTFADIVGSAPEFVHALKMAKMAANSLSPVMIHGETGTGKELFAQSIHNFHYGNKSRFVAINCAAIPESLMEGILFGTSKGAYTGAIDKAGLFERANGGTIFLDEIDSMPLSLQGKLLRVVQERKVRRVGSLNTVDLNVKVISTVNMDPREAVRNGLFRIDLYYRLAVVLIKIPPLRQRKWDIEELVRHFLLKYNDSFGKSIIGISSEVMDFFMEYDWPGNVRELEHVVEGAMNMVSEHDNTLDLKHINIHFSDYMEQFAVAPDDRKKQRSPLFQPQGADQAQGPRVNQASYNVNAAEEGKTSPGVNLAEKKAHEEIRLILDALAASGGIPARAARSLGITRQLLHYKLKKYGLK